MRLLIDTDAFCKLAIGDVLEATMALFGADLTECGRLAALPHMLKRGKLRKMLGDLASDEIASKAQGVQAMENPSSQWIERLAGAEAVDPGEAQLFALAAETDRIVVSGDKRALRALKDVPDICDMLRGRIVALEAALIALCDLHGSDHIKGRVGPLVAIDTAMRVCFSSGSPPDALMSYFRHLEGEVAPLCLWQPRNGVSP